MELTQIQTALKKRFDGDGERPPYRVVFWNDPDQEFRIELESICAELSDVILLNLEDIGTLEAKVAVERGAPERRHLIYSASPIPHIEDDWLLDIRLYSTDFSADAASILLHELGLNSMSLRDYLGRRKKFFGSKDRVVKLRQLIHPDDLEKALELKMMAVIVKAEQADLFQILRALFHSMVNDDSAEVNLDSESKLWEGLVKLELSESFWGEVKEIFGYSSETPTLRDLLIRLMVSDFSAGLGGALPSELKHFALPSSGTGDTKIFLANWRDSSAHASSYDALSNAVSELLKIKGFLSDVELETLLDVNTFLCVERAIAAGLRQRVQANASHINKDEILTIVSKRQSGHWVSSTAAQSVHVPRESLRKVYKALEAATELFDLLNSYTNGFKFIDAASMYHAYETELYRFDQLYRHFCEYADYAESEGWDILKPLRVDVSNCYENNIITSMGLKWGSFVSPEGDDSLLRKWSIDDVPNQQDFYKHSVQDLLNKDERRKVFVIISDAFRYEAAQELLSELNGKNRFKAELTSQFGVLPSYTSLGMAALLPHKELAYTDKGDVTVDGKSTSSSEKRGEILSKVKGIVIKADELTKMTRTDGRELVSEHNVVYIYHNRVDAIGDSGSTEGQTFEAVRGTINELHDIVRFIINELHGSQVFVTADHGFMFQERYPGETEKSKITDKPAGAIKSKKRYIVGRDLGDNDGAWHGRTETTAGAAGDMEFWIPKNTNLFHFMGGARFVHGGAMLQEVVVPVLYVQEMRGKEKDRLKVTSVDIIVLGSKHKITTNRYRFELLQTDAVSERNKAVTVKAAVYDGDEPVTNIETVTFDSTSGNMDDRKKWVSFTLLTQEYDKRKDYHLVLRDADTQVEIQRISVTIDRAFTNDF